MPKRTLNDRMIKALTPATPGRRYEVQDALVPGFAVRVTNPGSGPMCFVAASGFAERQPASDRRGWRHHAGKGSRKARDWIELIRKGVDPAVEEERQRYAALASATHDVRQRRGGFHPR